VLVVRKDDERTYFGSEHTHTHTHTQCVSICLLLVLASTLVTLAFAGTGTITVSGVAPSVDWIRIDNSPATGANNTNVDVDTWYLIKANISDTDKMNDIQRVEVRLYKTTAGWSETLDKEKRWGLAWKAPEATWEYLNATGWGTVDAAYFDTAGSSSGVSGNPASGIWTFKFKFDVVSHYTTGGGWTIQVRATDKSTNAAWRDHTFDVDLYVQITVPSTLSWSATAGQNNVTATGMPFAMTYKANAIVKFKVDATDPTSTFDNFAANNLLIDDDDNANTDTRCQKLSNSPTDWWTGLVVTSTGAQNAYWFVTVPVDQPTGIYTFTYTVEIAFESLAT